MQKDGSKRASRVYDDRSRAEARARYQAQREGAELVGKRADGTIERRDSHGADDRRKKG